MNKEELLWRSFHSAGIDARKDIKALNGNNLETALHIMHRMIAALGVYVVKKEYDNCYLNAMFNFNSAFNLLTQAKEILEKQNPNSPLKFLDVGCGFGNIVMIANELGFDGFGLDIQTSYCNIAKMLCGKSKIIKKDAMKYKEYSNYDCIYLFNPTKDYPALEGYIKSKAKSGMVIINAIAGKVEQIN